MPSTLDKIARRFRHQIFLRMDDFVRTIDLDIWQPPKRDSVAGLAIAPYSPADDARLKQVFPEFIVNDFAPRSSSSQGFVAWMNGQAIGYIWATFNLRKSEGEPPFTYSVQPKSHQAYLYDLKVTPAARGHGVGQRLMVAGMQWAKDQGGRSMLFTTALDNEPVHRLTRALGFRDVGVIGMRRILRVPFLNLAALRYATSQETGR
jgi:GNAT superfamily N-acetyltransferase